MNNDDRKAYIERFFRQAPSAGYLPEQAKIWAQSMDLQLQDKTGAFILKVGNEHLAWPTCSAQVLLGSRPIHSIPHRKQAVLKGIAAISGKLTTCLSLAGLLDIKTDKTVEKQNILLISHQKAPWGMLIDQIDNHIHFHDDDIQALPSTLAQSNCYSRGMLAWQNKHIPLLDEALVIAGFERALQ